MTSVLTHLKSRFPDLYELLQKNQGVNGLIFFIPKPRYYEKDFLNNRNFYYSHIFQKSKFDDSLYVNLMGKVIKSVDSKKFVSFLGWSNQMKFTIKSSGFNEDNLFYYITDGICIDELIQATSINQESETTLDGERFYSSEDYLTYYNESFGKDVKKYQKAKTILKLFISSMKNNNVLLKGQEGSYSKIFQENINTLISMFTQIFKNQEIIAKEYVDSFVFDELYDYIMSKIKSFYEKEEEDMSKKIKENISKYGAEELKLPKCIEKCDFSCTFSALKNLSFYKTSFEKTKNLMEIHNIIIEEVKTAYEKENGTTFEPQGDFLVNIWIYIITHSNLDNLISESVFFKYFQIKKGNESNDYITKFFIITMESLQSEYLKKETGVNIQKTKPFIIKALG